ncbi:DUF892 family protein [Pedobacter antarcticus]|uniref:DUF892 family protein n=1 Tax=Pedobacter antarcticus TaxID=34086 RepID=UPI00292FD0CF|nr:DUF892 family protein [Pedobacter antarcticus]
MEMQGDQTGLQLFYNKCLQDLKYGEKRVVQCATALSMAAYTEPLQRQLLFQAAAAENHAVRLDLAFDILQMPEAEGKCQVIEILTEKAGELVKSMETGTALRDAAIIYAIQLISHYKIASYSNMIGLLQESMPKQVLDLLKFNLDEEQQCDRVISALASDLIHPAANRESRGV